MNKAIINSLLVKLKPIQPSPRIMSMMPTAVQIRGAIKRCTDLLTSGRNRVMACFLGGSVGTGKSLLRRGLREYRIMGKTLPYTIFSDFLYRTVQSLSRKNRGYPTLKCLLTKDVCEKTSSLFSRNTINLLALSCPVIIIRVNYM